MSSVVAGSSPFSFCPNCGMLLMLQSSSTGLRLYCQCCPYIHGIQQPIHLKQNAPATKKVDDILGGADAWKDVQQADERCHNEQCDSTRAYFRQMQIRSADEPMTTFYKCVKCGAQWRGD